MQRKCRKCKEIAELGVTEHGIGARKPLRPAGVAPAANRVKVDGPAFCHFRRREDTTAGSKPMIPVTSKRTPRHPGRVLMEDFLSRLPGLTQAEVADGLRMSRPRLNELVNGVRGVTPDTAMRLARGFGTTPEFWLSAQAAWDLYEAGRSRQRMREIERIEGWVAGGARAEVNSETDDPGASDGSVMDLTTEIGVLAAGYAADVPGASYYEEFLSRKGLLEEAKRFVRIRAQLDSIHEPSGPDTTAGKLRNLVLSAPKLSFPD
ncbi:MAG: HigA family addiction module antidote protein [Gemmatimonadetes bacterium]|nr:HigA family addiction module antidote protein [Gemmatimonadota bacterium]